MGSFKPQSPLEIELYDRVQQLEGELSEMTELARRQCQHLLKTLKHCEEWLMKRDPNVFIGWENERKEFTKSLSDIEESKETFMESAHDDYDKNR
tara:strand:+ start:518 stop:802 length:285 start_codon:yes stop_codon:yes gene_type:complete